MFSFLKSKAKENQFPLTTDIHSHLLPGLDDGVQSWEESLDVISSLASLGYTKVITTPHIMTDFYRNEPEGILGKTKEINELLAEHAIPVQLQSAAEYYLDEYLLQKVEQNIALLTFGQRYLLFETNFINEPFQLKDFIFKIATQGYKPVLAHPERYQYMTMQKAEDLKDRGVLFQINIPSILGFYSRSIQVMAQKLIDRGWVDFLGSDCHNPSFIPLLRQAPRNRFYKKALELPLLNHSL